MSEYKKGNVVVSGFEGLQYIPLVDIVKQPADGLLYDLNRNEVTILTFIDDPKWINDYAVAQVIRELKRQLSQKVEKQELKFTDDIDTIGHCANCGVEFHIHKEIVKKKK